MNTSIVTGVLVKNSQGQILLVRKQPGVGPYPGTYLTPGGGVQKGELADHAALRELYEETGVKVANLRRVMFDEDITPNYKGEETHYVMLLYTAEYVSGELHSTEGDDDHLAEMKWFTPTEAKKLPLSPPLQKLLAYLGTWRNKLIFNIGVSVPDDLLGDS